MKNKKEKNTESKVRRFPKFYVLDIVVVLLIVAIFLGMYFRYNLFDIFGGTKDQTGAEISFSIKNIKSSSIDYIEIDDKVYFKDDGADFGTIMASTENSKLPLIEQPATETVYVTKSIKDDEGKIIGIENSFETIHYPIDTRVDATGRIKCSGSFASNGSFMLNGSNHIAPGQTFTVCTEKVTFQVTVLEISKVSG